MEDDIPLYIDAENILFLHLEDYVSPCMLPSKADIWYPLYRLFKDGRPADEGVFDNRPFIDEGRRILILQQYRSNILQPALFRYPEDAHAFLRLFDFANKESGCFSAISGGSFRVLGLDDEKIVYAKQYAGRTEEYECLRRDITMLPLKME
ncbi:MAG: hypothetical protein Q3966_04195 [Neisseria sp.]|nr:hypothetical protein [Neisseria sp.]